MLIDDAVERLYQLHVGTTPVEEGSPHERPHKPLLLLAAFDLIDEGKASPDRIPWSPDLRDRFTARFLLVRKHNDRDTPENPFFYLQTQGFWRAWIEDEVSPAALQTTPLVNQMGKVFARLTDGFEHLAAIPATRQILRESIISRYFPHLLTIRPPSAIPDPQSRLAEEPLEFGRSPAFRRLIVGLYDHQCAACGLRIKLAFGNDVSFIDAAHLIPFSVIQNDHPTNGLALCKDHHWAMDRDLIAPCQELRWQVSKFIDARRSNGEKELHALAGQSVLLPKDPAFHPNPEGLQWRCERLSA